MKSLYTLNHFFIKYKWLLVSGICFVILSNLFTIAMPYFVRQALNEIELQSNLLILVKNSNAYGNISGKLIKSTLFFAVLILISAIIKGFFMFLMRQTIIVMSRKIEFDLKNNIFKKYQELSFNFYRQNFTGDLMNRISDDVSKVRMYLGPVIMYLINLIFTFTFVIYMMFSVNIELSILILLPLPILSFSIYLISNIMNKKSDLIQEKLSDVTSLAQETFSGIRIIKSFAAEQHFESKMMAESENYRDLKMSLTKVESAFNPMMMLLVSLSTLITVYFGGKGVIEGTFTYGNIAEFVIYVNLLTWPVASLGWITSLVQRASASQTRINEFLNLKPEIINQNFNLFEFKNEIKFDSVSYKYPNKTEYALKNISINIEKGKTIGIMGQTGSGKTTIALLLLRLIEAENGFVKIDENDIKNINLEQYRSQIAYVPQDVFLFSDTLKNNILFGLDTIPTNEEIEKAAKLANVHEDIIGFKEQYDTMVGERGITLSGGQKQRIAIARALIKNPEIIILDDCLSAVDVETEKIILSNLNQHLSGKTNVIISHKTSSVKHAELIITLADGHITEKGNHSELILKKGYYCEMFNLQESK